MISILTAIMCTLKKLLGVLYLGIDFLPVYFKSFMTCKTGMLFYSNGSGIE